jgi:hypothetical protein
MRIFYFLILPLVGVAAEPTIADALTAEAAIKTRLGETRALLAQDREEAAETRLTKDSPEGSKTADWFQEKAADYLRIAFSAQESGDARLAQKAARQALRHLGKAEALSAGNADALSGISELRGVIYERLLGTTEEAFREYRKSHRNKTDDAAGRQNTRSSEPSSASEAVKNNPAVTPSADIETSPAQK